MIALSIITVNLNNRDGLKKTIESVVGQTFTDYEFLIIDGASTDGSVEILDNYKDKISWWVSEHDSGIYNAMNKGINQAKGKYCLFLNSGDWLADNQVISQVFAIAQDSDILSGNIAYYDSAIQAVKWLVKSPVEFTANALFNGTLPHQATFIKRELFDKYGFYNENLRIASDWLFFVVTLLEHQVTYRYTDRLIAYFNMEGISCQPETEDLPRQEQLSILLQKYPSFITDYNLLRELKEEKQLWEQSKEYKVYSILTKLGIINIGKFILRATNFVNLKIRSTYK